MNAKQTAAIARRFVYSKGAGGKLARFNFDSRNTTLASFTI